MRSDDEFIWKEKVRHMVTKKYRFLYKCISTALSLCQSENQLQTEGFGPLVTPGWATQAKMR